MSKMGSVKSRTALYASPSICGSPVQHALLYLSAIQKLVLYWLFFLRIETSPTFHPPIAYRSLYLFWSFRKRK